MKTKKNALQRLVRSDTARIIADFTIVAYILIIAFSAWFGHITFKPKISVTDKAAENMQQSKILDDPDTLNFELGNCMPGGNCNIEFINGSLVDNSVYPVSKDNVLKIVGWAVDIENERLPNQVVVRFTSTDNTDFYALSQNGLERDDVRKYLNLPEQLTDSGFELVTNLLDIPSGQYAIYLIIQFQESSYICDNGRKILIE